MLQVVDHPSPETCLDQLLAARDQSPFSLTVRFVHCQYYLPGEPELPLLTLFWRETEGGPVYAAVGKKAEPDEGEGARQLAERLELPVFDLDAPLPLQPVSVPKPWGREIWYSGIEQRGQSGVGEPGRLVPLPWLLAALPRRFAAGDERGINLLKILDPLPDEVYGDLYFEMHEEKREIYIVTRVDPRAWPDGRGAIRFGFNQRKRREMGSDEAFLAAYREAVAEYRLVREEVDHRFDILREGGGYDANEPLPAELLKAWADQLPQELHGEEKRLRAAMDSFTALRPLEVGDVISVPTHTPHSLQHGVRTVEFQTPVYERKILSFAQKVLTQGHWDTEEALAKVRLDTPEQAPFLELESDGHFVRERIVDFADFTVDRIRFFVPGDYHLDGGESYRIAMVVGGELKLGGIPAEAETAWLLASGAAMDVVSAVAGTALLVAESKR
ncbi:MULTISPECIES: hypothetical protein [unclassified Microbulbifer]|uniref:hypothetical protein n=1 Tax=unclassified Microbulbifer TaxID=2619833 RepID=UPI0027E4CF65|nr:MULTISPECIES: hypothetical protein [unclassified Microbulbifer]